MNKVQFFLLSLFFIWSNISVVFACSGNELVPEKIQMYYQEYQTTKKMSIQAFKSYTGGFCEGFRSALMFTDSNYNATYYPIDVGFNTGFRFGRKQGLLREKSKKFKGITLKDFGFEKIEVEGLVYLGFEQSEYRPLKSEELWWIEYSDIKIDVSEVKKLLSKNLQNSRLGIYAKVNAYRSPVSGYSSDKGLKYGSQSYGHLGGYQRAIVVQSVLEIRTSTKEERKERREK